MEQNIIKVAQKGIVFNEVDDKVYLLLVKYRKDLSDKNSAPIEDRYGCPGGKIDFDEDIDDSFVREIEEETGIKVKPLEPVGISSFFVKKSQETIRIIAIFRLAKFIGGEPKSNVNENMSLIEKTEWININKIDFENDVIEDEIPVIKKAIQQVKSTRSA